MIGTQIVIVSELLIEALDVHSTDRVLDVATGSGNAALAGGSTRVLGDRASTTSPPCSSARDGAPTPRACTRDFVEGDAEALPFDDGSFDVVSSVFGSMFAPDQERTADEIARVTRPGGRIGLVAHTPDGFIGQLFKTIGAHVPPPAGLRSPIQWGTEERLHELFDDTTAGMRVEKRHYAFRYRSPQAYLTYWRRFYGPTMKAFDAVGDAGRPAFEADLLELIARFNRADDGTMVVPSEYLEAVIVRR